MSQSAIREPKMPTVTPSIAAFDDYLSPAWENEISNLNASGETPQASLQEIFWEVLREPSGTQRLHHYLEAAIKARDLSAQTAAMAMKAWRALSEATPNLLPVPDAGVGPDGELLYTWNTTKYHFELEIFPNGRGEFFCLDLQTDEMWECEYNVGDPIPLEVIEKLKLFYRHD